jgi:hypothetical protein
MFGADPHNPEHISLLCVKQHDEVLYKKKYSETLKRQQKRNVHYLHCRRQSFGFVFQSNLAHIFIKYSHENYFNNILICVS